MRVPKLSYPRGTDEDTVLCCLPSEFHAPFSSMVIWLGHSAYPLKSLHSRACFRIDCFACEISPRELTSETNATARALERLFTGNTRIRYILEYRYPAMIVCGPSKYTKSLSWRVPVRLDYVLDLVSVGANDLRVSYPCLTAYLFYPLIMLI